MSEQERSEDRNLGTGESPDAEKLRPITAADPDRGRRLARRRWARVGLRLLSRAGALGVILGVQFAMCRSEVHCVTADRDTDQGLLASVCAREYEKTRDPAVAIAYARALYRLKDKNATAVANAQLVGPARADALYVLGKIATREERYEQATSTLKRARELHLAEGRLFSVAEDEHGLAVILQRTNRYTEALRMLDDCIKDAQSSRNRLIEGYCHLAAAETLFAVGVLQGASQELDRATPLLEADRDLSSLHTDRGNLFQEEHKNAQAVIEFEEALELAKRARILDDVIDIHINLAYSLAETGRIEDATRHIETARAIDHDDDWLSDRLNVEAVVAYRRGDLPRALAILEKAAEVTKSEDDKILLDKMAARIALNLGDLAMAEHWARRGIASAEKVRESQPAIELRSWILSRRRAPYDLLFLALARSGRAEEALIAFDQRYGRTLGDAISRPLGDDAEMVDLETVALKTSELQAFLPLLSAAPLMKNEDPRVVLDAVRSVDLLALIVAEGELWRLTSGGGRLELVRLGLLAALRPQLSRFITSPIDSTTADELGALLLPDSLVRETSDALRVVLDGQVANLPVAALRRRGRPLIAVRPVVRAARLTQVHCLPPMMPPREVKILADAQGDLPAARREAQRVAALFGTTPLVGADATRAALLAGARPDLLHLAVHADMDPVGGVLKMHNGQRVSALEIIARKLSSERVVLSGCITAVAKDDEGATSLAMAFLAGGASQVLATLRPVSDDGAEEATIPFYNVGGATHPVQALASVQNTLAETANTDWPYFVIFGHDTCH